MSNLSDLIPAGGGQNNTDFVADGAITSGKPVILTAAGKAAPIVASSDSAGSPAVFESAGSNHIGTTFDSDSNKVVVAYKDWGNSNYGTGVVGTVSGDAISYGTPVVFESAATEYCAATFDSSNNKVVIAYRDEGNSNYGTGVVGTVSGTSISFGTPVVFESAATMRIAATFDTNNNAAVFAYVDFGNSEYGTAVVGTVSGTAISFGTPVVYESASTSWTAATFDTSYNRVVVAYMDETNSSYGTVNLGSVSGTVITFGGTATVFATATTTRLAATYDSNLEKVVIAYKDEGNSNYGTAIVGTVTGSYTITFGTEAVFEAAESNFISATFDSSANKAVITYQDTGNSNYGTAIVGTVSGTAISFDSPVVFEEADTQNTAVTYDSNQNKCAIAYTDAGNSSYGTGVVFSLAGSNMTTSNFVGIADEAISASASGVIVVQGGTKNAANTILPQVISFGTPVVFEAGTTDYPAATFDSDSNKVVIGYRDSGGSNYGTGIVGTVSGTSISYGTPAVFESANTDYVAATFDSDSNKVVFAYQDGGNSSYGTAVVGTVSGTGISYGTPVVFESAGTNDISATFDSNENKVVIVYQDSGNSSYGTAIVGTVSGTAISYGTAEVFESAATTYPAVTFDSDSNKVVIGYRDNGNSYYGTAIVGTVSGTAITFGSPVVFNTGNSQYIAATFDSNSNKVVFAYKNVDPTGKGTAIVGTVSGTSISFGTAVIFGDDYNGYFSGTFDSNSNKVVISYMDYANSEYGTAVIGTVSGASISFGTPVVFEAAAITYSSATFDSTANKVVIGYKDVGGSNYGTGIVGTVADGTFTIGSNYYVQPDGTFATSAGTPSVKAGLAISTTSLLLSGDS